MKRSLHPGLPFILVCVLLDILGIGLIIPVLPQLVGKLAGNSASQAWWLGAMLVSYGLMQFCFAPTLGALSDRYGRRPLMLLGIFGLSIMFLVPALSMSLPVILASRFVGGMFSANVAVAQAYIADITAKEKERQPSACSARVSASVLSWGLLSAESSENTICGIRFSWQPPYQDLTSYTAYLFFLNP